MLRDPSPWLVAVFAHNEEKKIVACLDSIYLSAGSQQKVEVFVLANGCRDRTEDLVIQYSQKRHEVNLVSLEVGDKANAWNVYVHEIARDRELHFFVDGDVEVCPGALEKLHAALNLHPQAHAAAAFPTAGRSLKKWRRVMLEETSLAGNLYALRGAFINRIRACRLRLPIGWIREDGLVGSLAKWDLDSRGEWDSRRIVLCPEAGFRFRSLSWFCAGDWRLYWRRRIRYSIGHYQRQMLRPILKRVGIDGMPKTVQDLYRGAGQHSGVRWTYANPLFGWLALRRIKRESENASFGSSKQRVSGGKVE